MLLYSQDFTRLIKNSLFGFFTNKIVGLKPNMQICLAATMPSPPLSIFNLIINFKKYMMICLYKSLPGPTIIRIF